MDVVANMVLGSIHANNYYPGQAQKQKKRLGRIHRSAQK